SKTDVSCNGGSNGAASVSVLGGTPFTTPNTYAYSWTPYGGINSSAANLSTGTFYVTITDANNCDTTISIIINEPTDIIATPSVVSDVTCNGLSNGVAHVVVSGGMPGYNYQWMPGGASSATATGLAAGIFTVNVTDANGCSKSGSVSINQPLSPLNTTVAVVNVSCHNLSNGSLLATASGGTSPYVYSWPGGANTMNGLSAGTYSLTVTDAQGCTFLVNSNVMQPNPLAVTPLNTSAVSCFGGSNGSATVSVSGGTTNYAYSWTSGSSTATANGLAAGSYSVSVTDANNCQASASVSITEPSSALSVAVNTITDVSCFGGANGTANVIGNGGTSPYAFSWNPFVSSSSVASGLAAGSYTVTIQDAKNCQANTIVMISQPNAALSAGISSNNISCNGANNGSAFVSAAGGNGGYNYTWFPVNSSNPNLVNLSPGSYQVNVTDSKGCFASATVAITQPSILAATTTQQNVSCFGGNNGTASIAVSGGTAGYSYSWTSGAQTGAMATGLLAGTYTVTATDANGCQILRTLNISQPSALVVNTAALPAICNGQANGSISANVSGGAGSYTYSWLPSGGNGQVAAGLSAGQYTVSVSDANGCSATSTTMVNQPPVLSSNISSTSVNCKGGSNGTATVVASGGNGNYYYIWNPTGSTSSATNGLAAGNYSVTISDYKGCSTTNSVIVNEPTNVLSVSTNVNHVSCFGGSNGSANASAIGGTAPYVYTWQTGVGATVNNLAAGNYLLNVTDINGCSVSSSVSITQPTVLNAFITNYENAYCNLNNGQAHAVVSGGTFPYNYLWLPAVGNGTSVFNLSSGNYTIDVTDAKGCKALASVSITNAPGFTASLSSGNVSCNGGSDGTAAVSLNGGFAPFSYAWMPSGQANPNATGLNAGSHSVKVTDAKGCQFNGVVNISQPSAIALSIGAKNNVSCFGLNNGSATVSAIGGSPGYTYFWNTAPTQATSTASNLAAGNYTVIVSDINGCTQSISTIITEPAKLNASLSDFKNITCPGGADGIASAFAQYGTPPYNYQWAHNPLQNTTSFYDLTAGAYKVIISDLRGCKDSVMVNLSEPPRITTLVSPDQSICRGLNATISASGGNYYYWTNNLGFGNSHTVSPQVTTNYWVLSFDQNNCPGTMESTTVEVYSLDPIDLIIDGKPFICPGMEGMVYVSTTNDSPGTLTYDWAPAIGTGPGVHVVMPTAPTTYTVKVENHCGDVVIKSFFIDIRPLPNILMGVDAPNGCASHTVNFDDLTINATDPVAKWEWSFGDGNTSNLNQPQHIYEIPGQYHVALHATTVAGCAAVSSGTGTIINVYPNPIANFDFNPKEVYIREPIIFANSSTGAVSYNWEFGDGINTTEVNPKHSYSTPGAYQVTLTCVSEYGCMDEITKEIIASGNIVIPNAFKPSATGPSGGAYYENSIDNTVFFPYTEGVEDFHMMIFNRWGELIFESFDLKIGWDGYYRGKLCKQDVYVWKINARFIDKRLYSNIGDVTLLR
ncbi:MAG: PKD domain-containing protein, partial [Bacteroidetes bacterium]|nr:PKD domain-containing protein [Bacteroidota bacterium]